MTHTVSPSSFQNSPSVPCSPMHFSILETFPSDPPSFYSSVQSHLHTKPPSLILLHSLSQHLPQLQTTKATKQIPDVHQMLQKILLKIQIQLELLSLNPHTDLSLLSSKMLVVLSSLVPILP